MFGSQHTLPSTLPVSRTSTPVRIHRNEGENSVTLERAVTRTPLALRNAQYDYLSLSASPKKRKEIDGEGGGRYMDGGRGRGVRAEGSPARAAIRRPASTKFHLPGHPRLASFTPFPTPNLALRRISSSAYGPTSKYSSLADHHIFNDLPAGLLMQHDGDVSDSSFFAASEEGEDGDEDLVDVGDVSFQLEVELESELEAELEPSEHANEDMKDAESGSLVGEMNTAINAADLDIPAALTQVGTSDERKEEIANNIGAPGYVPSRIKDIETRQRRPIAAGSPLRPTSSLTSETVTNTPVPSNSSLQAPCSPALVEVSPSPPAANLSPCGIETIALPLPPHLLSPTLPSLHPTPTLDPIIDLTSRLNTLLHQKLTLTSENSTLIGERSALWAKKHENDARITRLLEEKVNLQAELKSSRKDNEELRAELEGRNSVCEKLCVLVKDAEAGDGGGEDGGEAGGEGREAKRRRIVDTVVMMSQAGMLDSKHWSNQGGRSVLQKRKDGPESFADSPSKRTCR